MMKKLFSLLFLGLFSLVAQCQTWPQQLNITYVKAPFNIQNIVMKSQGLLEKEFAEEGIKINWIPIKAGLNQVRGMAAGEIDMVAAMNTSTLLIANSAGNRIVIVDGVAHPDDTFAIVAKPEVKNIVDLKGRQIVGPKGTVLHHLLSAALKSSGVEMKDVNWVSMNLPASLTTLLGGRADAALLAAGGILAAEKAGFHALVKAKGLIETNLVLAARGDFAKEYPDVVRRVAKVNRQALQWALSNKSQAIALGAKELQLSKEDAAKLFEWSHFYSDLTQKDIDALQNSQRFLLEQKMMNRSVDINTLIFE
ncbi:ABC transporter substrate-binding protein [Parasutterella secunda]|uniref:ABC transporter substrate-binding protein n=1 Tax=Parasutterella secunda TaxID=626947 RepID=UPI0021AD0FB3|nr:NrtA/SsuA/CpmA family ABC transporter substrate-binding protein [Parasutterella secunda]MCR8920375.1 NrtA/SsuA/CpmA family ABC transporter substrate-binding protein [Parasutterella secunda]MDM8087325.1 NrtA/SsuA/CpmA family ABC transporter substrate-binding protein [Parasutterella secunda]MDM8217484.1 NrtA/SsuA/CpmA family ABC transporter substrate-binding protein [Parasutterella secunda]